MLYLFNNIAQDQTYFHHILFHLIFKFNSIFLPPHSLSSLILISSSSYSDE
ncbi:hypothetical protein HanIR_Chr16g0820341 [Helianthus annuus]|nr:hypothetical protein HanIR_Chr16g0820341 [Helianthus annuus]